MGNQAMIILMGMMVVVALFVTGLMKSGNEMTENAVMSYADRKARDVNNAAVEMALRTLSDSSKWRSSLSNIDVLGGKATITFKDTVVSGDSAVVIRSRSSYRTGTDSATTRAQVVVVAASGFKPPVVRGAFTAFGPINDAISDMFIDGRNFNSLGTGVIAQTGVFSVSTGQATFVNTHQGALGGTTYLSSPPVDIVPAFPHDPNVVETSSYWPNGWPLTPDAALDYPPGMLKNIAVNKLVPGSQFVTAYNQLLFPLKGVTYIEVPNGTVWSKRSLGNSPEGVLVFHSPATNAFWDNITTKDGKPFKGLMLMDNVFHIHMDILGALVVLTPNTVVGKTCNGNKDHWIRYSLPVIQTVTQSTNYAADASWKSRLRVVSWYE